MTENLPAVMGYSLYSRLRTLVTHQDSRGTKTFLQNVWEDSDDKEEPNIHKVRKFLAKHGYQQVPEVTEALGFVHHKQWAHFMTSLEHPLFNGLQSYLCDGWKKQWPDTYTAGVQFTLGRDAPELERAYRAENIDDFFMHAIKYPEHFPNIPLGVWEREEYFENKLRATRRYGSVIRKKSPPFVTFLDSGILNNGIRNIEFWSSDESNFAYVQYATKGAVMRVSPNDIDLIRRIFVPPEKCEQMEMFGVHDLVSLPATYVNVNEFLFDVLVPAFAGVGIGAIVSPDAILFCGLAGILAGVVSSGYTYERRARCVKQYLLEHPYSKLSKQAKLNWSTIYLLGEAHK